jgi:hypothetical protein
MTEPEAIAFVNDQVKGRNPKLADVQFGDWVAVVTRTDCATARQLVKDIATDPEEPFLTVKAFAKRLREHTASLRAAQRQVEAAAPCLDVSTAEDAEQKILDGPDSRGKRWLTQFRVMRARRQTQTVAQSPSTEPAPVVTYRCSQGHLFARPDSKRCVVGCCPQCREVNKNYKIVTPIAALES